MVTRAEWVDGSLWWQFDRQIIFLIWVRHKQKGRIRQRKHKSLHKSESEREDNLMFRCVFLFGKLEHWMLSIFSHTWINCPLQKFNVDNVMRLEAITNRWNFNNIQFSTASLKLSNHSHITALADSVQWNLLNKLNLKFSHGNNRERDAAYNPPKRETRVTLSKNANAFNSIDLRNESFVYETLKFSRKRCLPSPTPIARFWWTKESNTFWDANKSSSFPFDYIISRLIFRNMAVWLKVSTWKFNSTKQNKFPVICFAHTFVKKWSGNVIV